MFQGFCSNIPLEFDLPPLCKGLRKPRVAGCFRDLVANRAIREAGLFQIYLGKPNKKSRKYLNFASFGVDRPEM